MGLPTKFSYTYTDNVAIANGASLSTAADLTGTVLSGFIMPGTWTAAGVTFQGSVDGTNFYNVYDTAGIEVNAVVDASRFVRVNPADFAGFSHIKLRSGTSGSAVNQGGARTLILVGRKI